MNVGISLTESIVELVGSEESSRVLLRLERESELIANPVHANWNDHLLNYVQPHLILSVRPRHLRDEFLGFGSDGSDDQVGELRGVESEIDHFLSRRTRFRFRTEGTDEGEERRLFLFEDVEWSSDDGFEIVPSWRRRVEDVFSRSTLVDDEPFGRRNRSTSVVLVEDPEFLENRGSRRGSREGEKSVGRIVSVVRRESPHEELRTRKLIVSSRTTEKTERERESVTESSPCRLLHRKNLLRDRIGDLDRGKKSNFQD